MLPELHCITLVQVLYMTSIILHYLLGSGESYGLTAQHIHKIENLLYITEKYI